jgi:hypothetical protein
MIDKSLIRRMGDTAQQNGIVVVDEHLEILTRFQMHLLPHRTGQDDLAFFGENRGHGWKILPQSLMVERPITDPSIERWRR